MSRVFFLLGYLAFPLFLLLSLVGADNGIISYLSMPSSICVLLAFLCGLIMGWRWGIVVLLISYTILENSYELFLYFG